MCYVQSINGKCFVAYLVKAIQLAHVGFHSQGIVDQGHHLCWRKTALDMQQTQEVY